MRYRDIIQAGQRVEKVAMRAMMDQVRAAHGARIWPEIANPSVEQRTAMLYEVECRGLTVHDLGEAFAEAFQGRRLWCREKCDGVFSVEPVRCSGGPDVGRVFRFSNERDAAQFCVNWC
jgi:hypothetical protein